MISEDRIKHIISVARLMKNYCIDNNFDKSYCEYMFTLGFLHDIGYECCDHAEHNFVGGEILYHQNYKYAKEIKYHGVPNSVYC